MAIVFLVLLTFGYMAMLTYSVPYPNGRDVWFHILVARAYFKGQNGMVSPVVMDINNLPYPPLFHLLLVPFVSSVDLAIAATKILQLLFYPLGLLAIMLLVKKYTTGYTALLTGVLLVGTYYAFSQMQVRPQSLEMVLYPLTIWATLEGKTKTYVATMAAIFYLHSPISIAVGAGTLFYLFRKNKKDVRIWATIAVVAPIMLYQANFMFNQVFLDRWITSGDTGIITETRDFWANPLFWLLNGLGIALSGLAVAGYYVRKHAELSPFVKLMLYSFFGFFLAWPTWQMRVFQFAVIPMALFTARESTRLDPRLRWVLVGAVVAQAIIFSVMPVFWQSFPPYFDKYW